MDFWTFPYRTPYALHLFFIAPTPIFSNPGIGAHGPLCCLEYGHTCLTKGLREFGVETGKFYDEEGLVGHLILLAFSKFNEFDEVIKYSEIGYEIVINNIAADGVWLAGQHCFDNV